MSGVSGHGNVRVWGGEGAVEQVALVTLADNSRLPPLQPGVPPLSLSHLLTHLPLPSRASSWPWLHVEGMDSVVASQYKGLKK